MTKIDIMIPFYGDHAYLHQAVQSVTRQDDHNWRLTIIDDASPVGAAGAWLATLGHPSINYTRNDQNLGVNGNFSLCLERADADYVVFMGCDDLMMPNYISHMRKTIAEFPGASIIQPGVVTIDELGRPVTGLADWVKARLAPTPVKPMEMRGQDLAVTLLRGNWCYFPALCWRTGAIAPIGFRPDLNVALDLALIFDVVVGGGEFVVDPGVIFQYRRHAHSASSRLARSGDRFDEERAFFKETARECRRVGWRRAALAADMRATSRAHAMSLIPAAAASRQMRTLGKLMVHALAR